MATTEIRYDEEKLAELMLYVASAMADEPSFGATMLNKVLFFADFLAYRQFGSPITGAAYQRLDYGPAPRRLLPVQQQLVAAGDATVVKREHLSYKQSRLVALRPANVDVFAPSQVEFVHEVVDAMRGRTALDVSDLSHRLSVGWQVAAPKSDIPYNSVFLSSGPLNEQDVAALRAVARDRGVAA